MKDYNHHHYRLVQRKSMVIGRLGQLMGHVPANQDPALGDYKNLSEHVVIPNLKMEAILATAAVMTMLLQPKSSKHVVVNLLIA